MIEEQKYDAMHEESFLNDLWNGFTTQGRFDMLSRAMGEVVFEASYDAWLREFNDHELSMKETLGINEQNNE